MLALLMLAGCAPPLASPDTHVSVNAYLPGEAVNPVAGPAAWWTLFGSPALDALEASGATANASLAEARANLAAAQDDAAAADAAYLPQVVLNPAGSPAVSRQAYPAGPNQSAPYTIFSLTGEVTYDPGLFGASNDTFENGRALAEYQAAEVDAARNAVAGNIAAAAITLAGVNAQTATTGQILDAEQKLLALLQGEYEDGAISQLPVLQQQSVIEATEASLPPLRTQAAAQRDRLAVLTGVLPAAFVTPEMSLEIPRDMPVEVPSAYLAGRPDIRAALAQVAAQHAALGVAVAHMYPDFSLSASGGYAAETLGTLFGTSSALWALAGNLLAPIYEGGALHARTAAAQARLAGALAAYRGAVLTAFGQVADGLQAVRDDAEGLSRAQAAAGTAGAAYRLAGAQFQLGAADYTTVLAAQTAAAQAALVVVQARTALLLDEANLEAMMAK